MPANLNALIRYKTINSCLFGGKRKWTIQELIEKCSEALAEYRGRYESVSERTLRDDIRVMRSEILGFNAPIKQKGGFYFYDDPRYSIMSVSFSDSALIMKVIKLLNDLRTEVNHPELEIILEKLTAISGGDFPHETFENMIEYCSSLPGKKRTSKDKISRFSPSAEGAPCWGDVLGIIRKNSGSA